MSYFRMLPKGAAMSQAIDLKVKLGAKYNLQLNNETIDFDGVEGSQTIHQGSGGGELDISPIFQLKKDPKDLDKLKKLDSWYKNGKEVTVVYADTEKYTNFMMGGNYKIIDVDITEPERGRYDLTLKLQKQKIFPPETKSFTNWKPAAKKTTSSSATAKKANPLYTTLAKCKLPLYENRLGKNKTSNCDLTWQKILRLFKFYLKYNGKSLKLDGYFGFYTKDATKKFQRKYKIKVTGKCDTATLKKVKTLIAKL